MNNLAIIPARSGSKGLKDKNIRVLDGKPLLAWSIEAAVASGKFSDVMVSTDSEEYAEIARKYGAQVPFLRSSYTAGDMASSWDVVREVLDNYKEQGRGFDSVCLLQPTSPLRDEVDIKEAYLLFEKEAKVAVVSVCEVEHPIQWCGILPENRSLADFLKDTSLYQRQKSEMFYRINGAIYIINVKAFYKNVNLYREGSYAYIMPQWKSIDIDTELDFEFTELLKQKMVRKWTADFAHS